MDDIQQLLARAQAYSDKTGLKMSTISRKLLGNGIRLGQLEQGKSLRVDTLVRAKSRLDDMEAAPKRATAA